MIYKVILSNHSPKADLMAYNLHTGEKRIKTFSKIGELIDYLRKKDIAITLGDTILV